MSLSYVDHAGDFMHVLSLYTCDRKLGRGIPNPNLKLIDPKYQVKASIENATSGSRGRGVSIMVISTLRIKSYCLLITIQLDLER